MKIVWVLYSNLDGTLVVGATPEAVEAGFDADKIAKILCGGKGGGRKDFAQGLYDPDWNLEKKDEK